MPSGHGGIAHSAPMRLRGVFVALFSGIALAACAQGGANELSLDPSSSRQLARQDSADPRSELDRAIAYWGEQYAKTPSDKTAALSYALNLKAAGQKKAALQVLQQASLYHGNDREIASEYGRLALEFGQVGLAQKLLAIAYDPANPDWRVISAQGTVLAKQGDYQGAIPYYERALQLAPDQPSVVNNLAMALVADGQAGKAEPLLRRAAAHPDADPKVRQNLALVLDLQGKGGVNAPGGVPGRAFADANTRKPGARSGGARAVTHPAEPQLRDGIRDLPPADAPDSWSTRVAAAH